MMSPMRTWVSSAWQREMTASSSALMTAPACSNRNDKATNCSLSVQQKMHQFLDFIVRQKMTRSKASGTSGRGLSGTNSGQNPGLVLGLGLPANSRHDRDNEDTKDGGLMTDLRYEAQAK